MFVKVSKIYDNDASAHPGVPTGWGSISVELRADMVLSDQETNLPPTLCVCVMRVFQRNSVESPIALQ